MATRCPKESRHVELTLIAPMPKTWAAVSSCAAPAFGPAPGGGPVSVLDHFGPVQVRPEDQFDVRPHPHIGLATVTYLFEGAQIHRDNLGLSSASSPARSTG
jgi:redox-sensitive bicupin YhaK (pirin superfamily)